MKTCKGTRSQIGRNSLLQDDDFRINSTNKSTGAVYRSNICRKCSYKNVRRIKEEAISPETKLFEIANIAWR